jgi:hypothetical protein
MIKNVLIDEEGEESKKIEKEQKFNLKLLDLSSPIYQRKEKRLQHQHHSDNQVTTSTTIPNNSTLSTSSIINDIKKSWESKETSPSGFQNQERYQPPYYNYNLNQCPNNLNINSNAFFPNDYSNVLINATSPLNSTNSSSYFTENSLRLKKARNTKGSDENVKLLIESDDTLEMRMLGMDCIDEDAYEKLKGSFIEIITNQNCSRVLQNCLPTIPPVIVSKIFHEVYDKIPELMIDLYGNYFFQKFYGYLSDDDRIEFMNKIKDSIVSIANNKIGTYPLQAVIDKMRTPQEKDILVDSVKFNILISTLYLIRTCQAQWPPAPSLPLLWHPLPLARRSALLPSTACAPPTAPA